MKNTNIEILLAEDSEDEIILIEEAIKDSNIEGVKLNYVKNGVEVMNYLRNIGRYASCPFPDLLLLDLNMPKKNGHEVLEEIKKDDKLKLLPVIVLSTSQSEGDIGRSYANHANSYISKPSDYNEFKVVIRSIEDYWLRNVILPTRATLL